MAAVATAESLEAEEPKKKRGRPKGSGKKSVQPEPEPEPEPKPEPPSNKGDDDKMEAVKDIDWKSDDGIVLTWKLITAIEDDPIIRASLFLPIGSTKLSGGKPKSDSQAVKPKQKKSFYTKDATLTIEGKEKFVTFLVPKFHLPAHIEACNLKFNFLLTRDTDVGQTDGEAPERGWANANPLARSTKDMGPGFRRDTLDDHFNDWNHKKIIGLGYMMRRKVKKAVPEMTKTRVAFADMNKSTGAKVVEEWTDMALLWEADVSNPNPFETIRKDQHLAKVRTALAAEAAVKEAAGKEDAGAVKGDMHITELISMGLQLEEQQRILAFDVAATGQHPTDGQRHAMIEWTSKLRRKIFAWIDVQIKFFPALTNIREREDAARAQVADSQPAPGIKVSDITLWLPSAIAAAPGPDAQELAINLPIFNHE
ncbi:hypothetical protein B0H10DRAFT_2239446 [Mycena sp. CBHHK59/15]|nr:hypothetical protein B0H10DRAFT_2239446 [Mycena sp. CBHHK59/15]